MGGELYLLIRLVADDDGNMEAAVVDSNVADDELESLADRLLDTWDAWVYASSEDDATAETDELND